jgi:hypothetical protein
LFAALGPVLISLFGLIWALDLNSTSNLLVRVSVGTLSTAGLVSGFEVFASLKFQGDYYRPHSLRIVNGVIYIEGEALLALNEFGSFLTRRGWLFDMCELQTKSGARGYWVTILPAIFRYLKANVPIENVALGMTEIVTRSQHATDSGAR